jgi:hypothetical protein
MFKSEIEPERWTQLVDREIWLRLAKIAGAGTMLSPVASERLRALSDQYPEWKLAPDERDEFPFWMGEGEDWRQFVATPRRRRELMEWLRREPDPDHWKEDDWQQRCRDDFPTAACALCALAREDVWPTARWREALQAWSEEKLRQRSWRYMAPVLANAPKPVVEDLGSSLSWWLEAIAKTFDRHEALFLDFARRILAVEDGEPEDTDDPVGRAINHPAGHVTEALLRWWYRRTLEDRQGLPDAIKLIFTEVCDARIPKLRHGRVLLAAHVIALFRVDPEWATEHLLPLFEWQRSDSDARGAWEGFLWSPRLYRPLMEVMKSAFLETAGHYGALGKHDEQYAALLAFAALDPGDTFSTAELALATRALPQEGLHHSAEAVVRALEGAGDQRADYWVNRVKPYLHAIWPKSRENMSPAIAEALGRLCVEAKDAFPEALALLRAWLQPLAHPNYLVHRLHDAGLSGKFPTQALEFLSLVIGDQTQWPPSDLAACLERIRTAAPELAADQRLQRLLAFLEGRGLA